MQSNRSLLAEEPSTLAVEKKREGKDYETTEHTAGFVLGAIHEGSQSPLQQKKPFQISLQQQIQKTGLPGK